MVWINLILILTSLAYSKGLPKFLTKHSIETIRFISSDGRYTYVVKKPGVLGLVSSFRSIDFISDSSASDFLLTASPAHQRIAIEIIPFKHQEHNLLKMNKIQVVDWGNSQTKDMGEGINAKLHLQDEWISFYNPINKTISVKNVITQKLYEIKLSHKNQPFFIPEVEMVNAETVVHTDVNEKGHAALIQHNLITKKTTVVYKSLQSATHLELCQAEGYMAVGEFPFEGVTRSSSISVIKLSNSINLSGMNNIYKSIEQDIGNMICMDKDIYFVKTMNQDKETYSKTTEAVKLEISSGKVVIKSDLKSVSQLLKMDNRVMIPMRGEYLVLEGQSNISTDVLKKTPVENLEELPLDI